MGKKDNSDINAEGTNGTEESTRTKSTAKRGRPRKHQQPNDGTNGTAETETNIPKLVLVEVPDQDDDAAAAPAEKKAAASKSPSKKKRKDIQVELKKEQLGVLIKTIFDIAGSRKGFEIWKLSQEECLLISDPLANILNRNPYFDKVATQYGDYVALLIALGTIILPRAIMQVKTKKPEKEKVTYVNQSRNNASSGNESGKTRTSDNSLNGQPTVTSPNFGSEFHNYIPAIQ